MKKPQLQDFGIQAKEYAIYKGKSRPRHPLEGDWIAFAIPLVVALVVSVATLDIVSGILWGVVSFLPGIVVSVAVFEIVGAVKWNRAKTQLLESPVASQIKLYEEAQAAYRTMREETERVQLGAERERRATQRAQQEAERARRRKLIDHWMSLNGRELEIEMEVLCKRLGYRVESTPVSGDGGVDLILRHKSNEKVVVQCKSYKSPVGPAAVRELYGSMMHFGVSKAVLVCPAGFTQGVKEFVKGKPINLVAAEDLISLASKEEVVKNGEEIGTGQ